MTTNRDQMAENLRQRIRHLKVTAYAAGKPYNVNLATVIQKDDIEGLLSLFTAELQRREREAAINEAANIHKTGFKILMERGAASVVAGGTNLDKLLNTIERKYGKDLILHVYGDHNKSDNSQS